jgi:hypothetical protein
MRTTARPASQAFDALRVPAESGSIGACVPYPVGTPDAIDTVFASDIKGDDAMTYETDAELSGNALQSLRGANMDWASRAFRCLSAGLSLQYGYGFAGCCDPRDAQEAMVDARRCT